MKKPLAAAWLALLIATPLAASAQDAHYARNLAATCANCHGTDGKAQGPATALAGYPADRLVAALKEFKEGKRTATIMHQIAKGYSDEQVRLIASYFAAQK